ncbi:hypothetical protein KR054_001415, partial [Drosophila jambulina]
LCYIPVIACLLAVVQAQIREPTPREICQTVSQRCLSRVPVHGNRSEVTDILNARCRRSNRRWRNITRCELARATCQCKFVGWKKYMHFKKILFNYLIVTIERCAALSCANIRTALG